MHIIYEDAELYADLAAECPIAAERQGQKIIVEIKSFIGRSLIYDFHNALGQYIFYRHLIHPSSCRRNGAGDRFKMLHLT